MKKIITLAVILFTVAVAAQAQVAQFQALYIYNFAKNTGWPPADANREIVITVIGDNALAAELTKFAKTRKIGTRSVIVKHVSSVTAVEKSDIIFLGEGKSGQISALNSSQAGQTVLIITGRSGLCSNGASISFVAEDGKLNYEISNENIKDHGLTVSQKLLSLGKQV